MGCAFPTWNRIWLGLILRARYKGMNSCKPVIWKLWTSEHPSSQSLMLILHCAGQMKDILTTGLGMFLFGDVRFEAKNVAGVCVGLLGGIAYALISYRESRAQKQSVSRRWFCLNKLFYLTDARAVIRFVQNSLARFNGIIFCWAAVKHMGRVKWPNYFDTTVNVSCSSFITINNMSILLSTNN